MSALTLPSGYTLGLDAEFIIRHRETGEPISVVGLLGGSKEYPRPVPYGALQEDGALAEININPARNLWDWNSSIAAVLAQLQEDASQFDGVVDLLSITGVYSEGELWHPAAREAGCDPDFNCWHGGAENPRPVFNGGLRTCGGHIHVGYDKVDQIDRREMACILDTMLVDPLAKHEPANDRRKLYGTKGSFRPKPYGVEMRGPSNFWLRDEALRTYAFHTARQAIEYGDARGWEL